MAHLHTMVVLISEHLKELIFVQLLTELCLLLGWYGANGYTVIISHENGISSTYGHVSETFIVSIGQKVSKGQIIAHVGPKYVSKESTYKDSTGKYTNGATTGPHLHLAISKNGKKIDPLSVL